MKKINNNLPRGGAEWGRALRRFLSDNIVPIMFVLICAYCIPRADLSWNYLLNEGMTRLGRNAFLILSLLIPVMAGMGMNFGMTLGAMAGQIGLIFAADWQVWGIPGLILAAIISIPISVLLGIMIGKLLNRAKGREMITSYMIAFAMDGVYQFFVLFMMGPVIPIIHNTLKLPRGIFRLRLAQPVTECEPLTVEVRGSEHIPVHYRQMSDTAANERFGACAAYAAHTEQRNARTRESFHALFAEQRQSAIEHTFRHLLSSVSASATARYASRNVSYLTARLAGLGLGRHIALRPVNRSYSFSAVFPVVNIARISQTDSMTS